MCPDVWSGFGCLQPSGATSDDLILAILLGYPGTPQCVGVDKTRSKLGTEVMTGVVSIRARRQRPVPSGFPPAFTLCCVFSRVPAPKERKQPPRNSAKRKADDQGPAEARRPQSQSGRPRGHPRGAALCVTQGPPLPAPGFGAFCRLGRSRGSRISAVVQRPLAGVRRSGPASLHLAAPGLRRPSHGLGGGGEPRGGRRALGAHPAVRPAARAAGRALRRPGQLRRRAGLARPG